MEVCQSVLSGCGLCDRGHWRRSFRLRDLSKQLCFHLAQVQNSPDRNSVYPFAAIFFTLTAYSSRQAESRNEEARLLHETEWKAFRQCACRTRDRELTGARSRGRNPSEGSPIVTRSLLVLNVPLTMRRRSRKPQESTSSQNKKRIARARKFIGISVCQRPAAEYPRKRCEGSVCKAKRVSQTKRRNFKRLRGE